MSHTPNDAHTHTRPRHQIVEIQTHRLTPLPVKFEVQNLKDFAQLGERYDLARLTHQVQGTRVPGSQVCRDRSPTIHPSVRRHDASWDVWHGVAWGVLSVAGCVMIIS